MILIPRRAAWSRNRCHCRTKKELKYDGPDKLLAEFRALLRDQAQWGIPSTVAECRL